MKYLLILVNRVGEPVRHHDADKDEQAENCNLYGALVNPVHRASTMW